jgi:hypothetical protein
MAGALVAGLVHKRPSIGETSGIAAPLPLLASIEPSIVWIARAQIDEVLWGPDFGEVICAGQRALCAEPTAAAEAIVNSWADAHTIPIAALEAAPLMR